MATELIISVTSQEMRIAKLENNILTDIQIERGRHKGIVGNIYKGKVMRILPGMQAAFVDIGLEKAAFLHVSDISPEMASLKLDDDSLDTEERKKPKAHYTDQIQDLIKEGQELIVQVAKDPMGTKGARLSSHISLAGRHLVYMPTISHVGVSRKIENDKERGRLKGIINKLRFENEGFIARTLCEGQSAKKIKTDIFFLHRLWKNIQKKQAKLLAPSIVYSDLNILLRTIRDLLTDDVKKIVVDSKRTFKELIKFISQLDPQMQKICELYRGSEPVFEHYEIDTEISRALEKKVWLKSGGYIIIDETEALVSIDVNTGKFVGSRNLEDTIFKTNLEAVKEVVYQLKLRNLGGIIIIDFIDMDKPSNREKIYKALEDALKNDKAKSTILRISELGLVEMTRKRVRASLGRSMQERCPYCEGNGLIKSKATICYEIFRKVRKHLKESKSASVTINVNTDVASFIYDEEREWLEMLEERLQKKITIKGQDNYHIEQYDFKE
jgi:ribonuclease G